MAEADGAECGMTFGASEEGGVGPRPPPPFAHVLPWAAGGGTRHRALMRSKTEVRGSLPKRKVPFWWATPASGIR